MIPGEACWEEEQANPEGGDEEGAMIPCACWEEEPADAKGEDEEGAEAMYSASVDICLH